MTFGYGGGDMPEGFSEAILSNQEAEDCLIPMGITSENVAADFNIPRQVQDEFAAKSFQKAAAAQKAGKFKDEIVPLKVKVIDPKTEKEVEVVVAAQPIETTFVAWRTWAAATGTPWPNGFHELLVGAAGAEADEVEAALHVQADLAALLPQVVAARLSENGG